MYLKIAILFVAALVVQSCQAQELKKENMSIEKTPEEWKKILSPEQYYVLREKGTERPFSGKFYMHKDNGVYVCAGCGNELFTANMKFDS